MPELRSKIRGRKGGPSRQGAPAPVDAPAAAPAAAYTTVKRRDRRYGWRPDLPDHRDLPYGALRLGLEAPAKLPPSIDLRAHCPPVYIQGDMQSCTANALAAAFQFLEIKSGSNKLNPSRLFIYYNERDLEDDVDIDNGAQLRNGIKSIATSGICDEVGWPYDKPFADKPPQSCYDQALKFRAVSYFSLDNTNLDELRGCLAAGFPFVFGFSICKSFTEGDNGIVPMPDHGEPILAGHAVMAVGYDDATQRFTVQNSWGVDHGDHGFYFMPYPYVTSDMAASFWTVRTIGAEAPASVGAPQTAAAAAAVKQGGGDQSTSTALQGQAAPAVAAATFTVHHGKRYQATITLSWLEQQFVTNGTIAGQFAQLGFTEVAVTGDGATRQATGRWLGADTGVALDPHLSDVVELA